MQRKIIAISLFLVLMLILVFIYVNKSHRDIGTEQAFVSTEAKLFLEEFEIGSSDAEHKYLDKTVVITGQVTEKDTQSITLDHAVFCLFLKPQPTPTHLGELITLKGRFIGYDDLLMQIKLDQCSIINNNQKTY